MGAFVFKVLFFAVMCLHFGVGQAVHAQGFTAPNDAVEHSLESRKVDGKYIYLVCIYGSRDGGEVRSKCTKVRARLRAQYHPKMKIIQVHNPSEERLKRINQNLDGNIAFVIVVTHSTRDETGTTWDVWDTDMDPSDLGECFDGEWVIWNGCYSKAICEEADNLVPVQCEDAPLSVDDDTWWDVVECLLGSEGPITREGVCEQVFGENWRQDIRDDTDE